MFVAPSGADGIGSDPIKLQRMRELARARDAWAAAGAEAAHPAELQRFTLRPGPPGALKRP
jgi:hypothetical protein